MAKDVDVIVTVDDDALGDIDELAAALRPAGLEVREILEATGQILGRTTFRSLDRLRRIKGVLDVVTAGAMKIPPPDADVQ